MAAENLPVPVHVLGVNAVGQDSANDLACAGRVLPWLQDDATTNAWGLWSVAQRDLVVLDRHQAIVEVYNLTSHDLARPENRDEAKAILRRAAAVP